MSADEIKSNFHLSVCQDAASFVETNSVLTQTRFLRALSVRDQITDEDKKSTACGLAPYLLPLPREQCPRASTLLRTV